MPSSLFVLVVAGAVLLALGALGLAAIAAWRSPDEPGATPSLGATSLALVGGLLGLLDLCAVPVALVSFLFGALFQNDDAVGAALLAAVSSLGLAPALVASGVCLVRQRARWLVVAVCAWVVVHHLALAWALLQMSSEVEPELADFAWPAICGAISVAYPLLVALVLTLRRGSSTPSLAGS